MIPLVDLKAQYRSIQAELDGAIREVIERGTFVGGEELAAFEAQFAEYCQCPGCVGVANGTDALTLALRALEIGPGAEVITVAHTFIATAEAIVNAGATPVFVDIRPDTMLMDPDALPRALTPRTRAIIPVHLYGHPCDMEPILEFAHAHRLKVVEDAAQAHGASYKGRRVGSFGDAACFSFYPGKNLGAYGDGGAVISQDEKLIQKIRMLANHGRKQKYTHEFVGVNSRLDTLQAAILAVKLRHLDRWNLARRRLAAAYSDRLSSLPATLPVVAPQTEPVWHLYVLCTPAREPLRRHLANCGIASGVHYPLPLHLQPAFQEYSACNGQLPVTEKTATQVLSIPMYPELDQENVEAVAQQIHSFLESQVAVSR